MKALSLFGSHFGRLLVIGLAANRGRRRSWVCQCECGNVKIIQQGALTNGLTNSCGCLRKEMMTTHGRSRKPNGNKTPEYRTWQDMKNRCLNPKDKAYKNYGGRGIKICARWMKFENFFADMGPRPSQECRTIDRIDNDGNYEPSNCKWATYKEQAQHRRKRQKTLTIRNRYHAT